MQLITPEIAAGFRNSASNYFVGFVSGPIHSGAGLMQAIVNCGFIIASPITKCCCSSSGLTCSKALSCTASGVAHIGLGILEALPFSSVLFKMMLNDEKVQKELQRAPRVLILSPKRVSTSVSSISSSLDTVSATLDNLCDSPRPAISSSSTAVAASVAVEPKKITSVKAASTAVIPIKKENILNVVVGSPKRPMRDLSPRPYSSKVEPNIEGMPVARVYVKVNPVTKSAAMLAVEHSVHKQEKSKATTFHLTNDQKENIKAAADWVKKALYYSICNKKEERKLCLQDLISSKDPNTPQYLCDQEVNAIQEYATKVFQARNLCVKFNEDDSLVFFWAEEKKDLSTEEEV